MKRWLLLLVLLLLYGCSGGGGAGPSNATMASVTTSKAPGSVSGVIHTTDGKPAAGAKVRAFPATSVPTTKALRIAQSTDSTTDSSGQFTILNPPSGTLNIEASLSDDQKVFLLNVSVSGDQPTVLGTLTLQPTGNITGKVTAPSNPAVTNFEGIDVFIPGSSYVAKAAQAGNYTISNVAVGVFAMSASKGGLGKASITGVEVHSRTTTTAPDLALVLTLPAITQLSPSAIDPGKELTVTGDNFGASTGETLQVNLGGTIIPNPNRVDDHTIKFVVPTDAQSGKVVIVIGGIPSNSVALTVLRVTGVAISPASPSVQIKAQAPLAATVQLDNATSETSVTWSSADAATATIDANGVVTGVSVGSTKITATSTRDPSKSTTATLVVTAAPVIANPTLLSFLGAGQTDTFTTSQAYYAGAFTASTPCTSSNGATVATVAPDASGTTFTVTSVGAGGCTITVTGQGGNTSSITIEVTTTSLRLK